MVRLGILPTGVVVRLGRQIRIDPDALAEFLTGGGRGLDSGCNRTSTATHNQNDRLSTTTDTGREAGLRSLRSVRKDAQT
jgi:hypothetical protein